MYYDFHIHSCLSPCSQDDMTPNNIAQMAYIKGLDIIAVTDHNSLKQQHAIEQACNKIGIQTLFGVEIQTIEEVHLCCYFKNLVDCDLFQSWIDEKSIKIANNEKFFGKQVLCNENDEVVGIEPYLLINSLNVTLNECIEQVHCNKGKVVLAHVLDRVNSITHQLGFIPRDCQFDGIEVKNLIQIEIVKEKHPWIQDTFWFINSDAHQLIDINEKENYISSDEFEMFWR